jgi:hypothetical protein
MKDTILCVRASCHKLYEISKDVPMTLDHALPIVMASYYKTA